MLPEIGLPWMAPMRFTRLPRRDQSRRGPSAVRASGAASCTDSRTILASPSVSAAKSERSSRPRHRELRAPWYGSRRLRQKLTPVAVVVVAEDLKKFNLPRSPMPVKVLDTTYS